MFRLSSRESFGGERTGEELFVNMKWKFRLVFAYSFNSESEKLFDELCNGICAAFNENSLLNGTVRKHTGMKIINKYDSEYHSVLVHNADMEMETE